jgi:hypothetical protein
MPGTSTSTLEVTNVSKHGFWLLLDGRELFLPFEDFPWFKRAPSGGNPAPRAAGAWAPPLARPRRRSSHRVHRASRALPAQIQGLTDAVPRLCVAFALAWRGWLRTIAFH